MKYRKRALELLGALLITVALIMEYGVTSGNYEGYSGLYKVMYQLWKGLSTQTLLGSTLFIVFAVIMDRFSDKIREYITVWFRVVALLLAIMMAIGLSMQKTNSLILLYSGYAQVIKTVIVIIGYYIFYLLSMCMLYWVVKEKKLERINKSHFWEGKSYVRPFMVLSVVWLPQIILKYPGAMCYDSYNQIYQYFGQNRFTSHHPPFHTLIIGGFVKLGKSIGHPNVGLFLFVLVQTFCFIAILSYTFVLLEKWNCAVLYRTILLLIYCIVPYYVGYAGVVVKDTMYGMSFLLYFLCLLELMHEQLDYFESPKNCVLFVMASAFVTLFRNNGIYVVVPMALALLLYFAKSLRKDTRKVMKLSIVIILPIVLYSVINSALFSAFDIQKGSKREMLSIPFQQTARYLREYGDEVTVEEEEAIDAILDYQNLGQLYDPRISDPVKGTYKDDATSAELKEYFRVWMVQLKKHPLVYFEATFNSIYSMFCPDVDNYIYYANAESTSKENAVVKFTTPAVLKEIQDYIVMAYKMVHEIPLISFFSNPAVYVVLFLFLWAYMIKDRMYKELLLFIPGMLSIAICIASPVILGHPRYLFPIVYTTPVLFVFYSVKVKERPIK